MVAPSFVWIESYFGLFRHCWYGREIGYEVVHKEKRAISVDELEQALELTDKKYIAEEQNMLEGIIRFGARWPKK